MDCSTEDVDCLLFKKLWECCSLVADGGPHTHGFFHPIKHPPTRHSSFPQFSTKTLLHLFPTPRPTFLTLLLLHLQFNTRNRKKIQIKTMYPGEVAGMQYLAPVGPSPYPAHFGTMQNNMSSFHYSNLLRPYPTPTFQIQAPLPEFPQQTQSLSNNSTSDEADEIQMSVIDERKQRRMISNRESARRSRMRKQRHLDELWSQVVRLRAENRQLLDKLNHVSECHDRVLHENERLREEASGLRRTLQDLQLDDPYAVLRDIEEVPCNSEQLRAESTNQPDACSVDLLH
ncbi:hypothetical protein ACLOJK_031090 [Asimina triloba]